MTKDEIRKNIRSIIEPFENLEMTPQLQEDLTHRLQNFAREAYLDSPHFKRFEKQIKEGIKVELRENGFRISFPVDVFE
jgi:phenylacetate-coenzyme A ligase PaaK-like adenylate-forming protein